MGSNGNGNGNGHGDPFEWLDIPIVKLVPRTERKVGKKHRQRIEASLKVLGMIDPLIVYPQGDDYEILDGCLRYQILLELGVEKVPCIIGRQRESFTGNRMVNQLSASQEMRMLRRSLDELDEQTIANALGMRGIKHRLNSNLLKKLHPDVVKAFEADKLTLPCAREFTHVKSDRQAEILKLMQSCNDYSITFAKGLVLKTPVSKRTKLNGHAKSPWKQADGKRQDLLNKLREAEQQQDFYSGLYKQYATNLIRLVIYARTLMANEAVRAYLDEHYPELVKRFEQIINTTEQ